MGKKILVADDSLTIQKVVELTFADSDFRLTCVSNGRLALEKAREDPPDLILADVVMPEKNGYEVCEEIKKNPATAGIPVVLLAGTFEPFDRERATRLGCDAIVSKPFDSRELYRKVESLIAGRSGAGAPRFDLSKAPPRASEPPAPEETATDEASAVPSLFAPPPPNPFEAGFVEEDFTGSIRTLRAGRGEPLANLYGPEDVESALAAFQEVEPTSRAAEWRVAAGVSETAPVARGTRDSLARHLDEGAEPDDVAPLEPEPEIVSAAAPESDEGATQRIETAEFRSPRTPPRDASTVSVQRDAIELGSAPAPGEPEVRVDEGRSLEFGEPLPPLPTEPRPPVQEASSSAPPAEAPPTVSAQDAAAAGLSDADVERLAEKLATKLVEKLSDRIVREVAWEVVPETAELVVRERLRDLESGVE